MIFVDRSFFFPLLSARDRDHERVRAVFESLRGRRLPDLLLTTNHVVGETITLARARGDHALAVHVGEYLYSEKIARVHWTTSEQELAAFALNEEIKTEGFRTPEECNAALNNFGETWAQYVEKAKADTRRQDAH